MFITCMLELLAELTFYNVMENKQTSQPQILKNGNETDTSEITTKNGKRTRRNAVVNTTGIGSYKSDRGQIERMSGTLSISSNNDVIQELLNLTKNLLNLQISTDVTAHQEQTKDEVTSNEVTNNETKGATSVESNNETKGATSVESNNETKGATSVELNGNGLDKEIGVVDRNNILETKIMSYINTHKSSNDKDLSSFMEMVTDYINLFRINSMSSMEQVDHNFQKNMIKDNDNEENAEDSIEDIQKNMIKDSIEDIQEFAKSIKESANSIKEGMDSINGDVNSIKDEMENIKKDIDGLKDEIMINMKDDSFKDDSSKIDDIFKMKFDQYTLSQRVNKILGILGNHNSNIKTLSDNMNLDLPVININPNDQSVHENIENASEYDMVIFDDIIDVMKSPTVENRVNSLIVKIPNYITMKENASVDLNKKSVYSRAFYTQDGYKMCLRIFPNGDGIGDGTHVSVYFKILKSTNDWLLEWPFNKKISFKLLSQTRKNDDYHDTFLQDLTNDAYKRPTSEYNAGFGCAKFVMHSIVEDENYDYLLNGNIFLAVEIQ